MNTWFIPATKLINDGLTYLAPGWENYIVVAIALLLAFVMKRKMNSGKIMFIILSILVFASLRYFGMGVA